METGTTSFLDRMAMTQRLDENLKPFMSDLGFEIYDYGHPVILKGCGEMHARIRRLEYKKSEVVLMIKFSPDFIVINKKSGKEPFFLDTKTSITPVFFQTQINRIRTECAIPELKREDIFDVEREAWDVYKNHYPSDHLAICVACPYHPRLLVADWVSNITPLFRFQQDQNLKAHGSGTPHVNLHMGKMRTLAKFLEDEFNACINYDNYQILLDFVKLWPLNKTAGIVNWTQFNNVIVELQDTCPWLETRCEPPGWVPKPHLFKT
jgi:hypothetical protein